MSGRLRWIQGHTDDSSYTTHAIDLVVNVAAYRYRGDLRR